MGNTPPAVPERMANLWVTWNGARVWEVQGGIRYVGSRYLNNANTISTPGYTVVDGGVRRRLTDRVGVDLRLYNLFDEFTLTTSTVAQQRRSGSSAGPVRPKLR